MQDGLAWFALRAKPRHERSAATSVSHKGYEVFFPTYALSRRWSDRIKRVELPLFPGYFFCRFRSEERLPVLTTPGVLYVVNMGGQPAPVDDQEIASLQSVVSSELEAQPWEFLRNGDRVTLIDGPLRGLEGILVRSPESPKLIVSITLLQRSVAVEIDGEWLRLDLAGGSRVARAIAAAGAPPR